jgi:hypothetical protein
MGAEGRKPFRPGLRPALANHPANPPMADDAAKRKQISDWINKPYSAYQAHAEKQKRLFAAFNEFVSKHDGAFVVSAPGSKVIRIECPPGSSLPIRLAELGYKLQFCGTGTRTTSSGFVPVDIIETKLPGR